MRKIQIICDGCFKIIEGNPIKIILEEVKRDDRDFATNFNPEILEREYCRKCAGRINNFINGLPDRPKPAVINKAFENAVQEMVEEYKNRENKKSESCTGATADTEEKEDQKAAVKKNIKEASVTRKDDVKNTVKEASAAAVPGRKPKKVIDEIKKMILSGYSNEDIVERLEGCTLKSISSIRYRMKQKNLIPDPINCDIEHMKKCKYGAPLNGSNASNEWYCNYLDIVGKSRACDASQCICYREE